MYDFYVILNEAQQTNKIFLLNKNEFEIKT